MIPSALVNFVSYSFNHRRGIFFHDGVQEGGRKKREKGGVLKEREKGEREWEGEGKRQRISNVC